MHEFKKMEAGNRFTLLAFRDFDFPASARRSAAARGREGERGEVVRVHERAQDARGVPPKES